MKTLFFIFVFSLLWLQFGRKKKWQLDEPKWPTALEKAAVALDTDTATLAALHYLESRGNANAINPHTRAHGQIQWMQSTAVQYDLDTTQLKTMTSEQQLAYEVEYLKPVAGKGLDSFYFRIFFPAAIGKHDDWTLQSKKLSPWRVAKYNTSYDLNKDSTIQVWEVKKAIRMILNRRDQR